MAVGGGIRERWRARKEAAAADAPAPRGAGPGWLAPVLLVVFFLAVVLIVVKMGGGEDDDASSSAASGNDTAAAREEGASAEPTGPLVAPPGSIEGTVRSRFALAVYKQPEARGKTVLSADHGTRVMVVCHIAGQVNYTNGKADPTWAKIIVSGRIGFVHVGQLETGGVVAEQVPECV
ncbi:hypothetical protein LO772_28785 [Yinghuangia sp. ASG 101]|uniref:hypothetical protein n=1 Tax=Yinghuangia sp. ASG 101 TaxID=2896848 RepID=UPI001E6006A8|nr:hypothetical protein [Yinghuangia sp. ASG 101]UGQ10779.1 hypothetical protein LO772_28785 [Yinghuangia sp. ASG 101]